jgi:glycosyltransferase involved in cell wall biosynthesis
MKIGIDCRLHFYNRTGIGRYIRNLLREFPDCVPADLELVLLQSRREREALIADSDGGAASEYSKTIRSRKVFTPAHHPWERWALATEVAPKKLDLLHSPDHVSPRRLGWRSVVTIHDLAFLAHPEAYSSQSIQYYTQVFRSLHQASKVIAVSDFTRNEVLNRISIAPERVVTIHEAADPAYSARPAEECASVRSRLEIPESYFLVVGTIEARKNLERLIGAYALLPRKDRPHLVFAGGSGFHSERVLEAVEEHRLQDHVRFLGHVNDDDLPPLYTGARCLLFPSSYEGFGLPILEAMACGCPVITSESGSLAEVAGNAALLVDPIATESIADGMRTLIGEPTVRADLIAKGHTRVQQFSWRTAAEQTLAVYREAGNLD